MNELNSRRRGSLSFLETTIDTSATRSEGFKFGETGEVGATSTHHVIEIETPVEGDENQAAGRA